MRFLAKKAKDKEEPLEEDLLEGEEIESHYPSISKPKEEDSSKVSEPKVDAAEITTPKEELETEEEEEAPKYKYLDLKLIKGAGKNDYKVQVIGQSHGFLNAYVKHLLQVEGVKAAAYKVTQIDPPEIFVRIKDGYNIKNVLAKGIESLRKEVLEVQEVFKKLM